MAGPDRLARLYRNAFFFLLGLYLALNISGVDGSCLDAADSAYLVSAEAVSRGELPYADFLVAHPPLLYLLGAPLALIGWGTLPFRLFSLLVMAGLGLATWRLALKLSGNGGIAFLAGAFLLFAPLGIFFSKLFIQDALVALLAVAAIILLLGKSRRSVTAAGLLCILGTLTKLTFIPLLAVFIIYVYRYRRDHLSLFLKTALAGSLTAALLLQLVTSGAYFDDIIFSQASKGYSLSHLGDGLSRVWSFDWPLILAAVPGLWLSITALRRVGDAGRLFLLLGWLAAGALVLLTLAAEGHDTNLFQLTEPALALLAAWGIIGLAEKATTPAVAAAVILMLVSTVVILEKDRTLIWRTNERDVDRIVAAIEDGSAGGEAVMTPGCYALRAGRPVTRSFYDHFLWEEKYQRGDEEALDMFSGLAEDLNDRLPPVVVFEDDRASIGILHAPLDEEYVVIFRSDEWPPVTMWLPDDRP